MKTLYRSAWALWAKEIQHHWPIVLLLSVLSAAMCISGLSFQQSQGGASLASVGVGLVYYWMPIPILVFSHRLVVLERTDQTHNFLAALPPPAWLRISVKFLVGLLQSWVVGLGMLALILLFAAQRELVTLGWSCSLLALSAVYLMAWLAIAFAIAHLGRYRSWVWMLLLGSTALLEGDTSAFERTWHAVLAGPTDLLRHEIPITPIFISLGYAVVALAMTIFLASWHGGSLPDRWYKQASTRERIAGVSVVLFWMFLTEVLPEVERVELVGWDTLPTVADTSHKLHVLTPSMQEHGQQLEKVLGRLQEWSGQPLQTTIVLTPSHHGPTAPERAVQMWDYDEQTLVLRVSGKPSLRFQVDVLQTIVEQLSGGVLYYVKDRNWAYDGLGLFLAEPAERSVAEKRAAWAVTRGLTQEQLGNWQQVRLRYGQDIAAGVGALGLLSLEQMMGREAAGAWVNRALLQPLSHDVRGSWGVSSSLLPEALMQRHQMQWWHTIQEAYVRQQEVVKEVQLPVVKAQRVAATTSTLDVHWELSTLPQEKLEWLVREQAPARKMAVLHQPVWSTTCTATTGQLATWAPAWRTVEATARMWSDDLQGYVISGWQELQP